MEFTNNRKIEVALKALLFVCLAWFIANTLFLKNNFTLQKNFFLESLKHGNAILLVLAIALMPLNWLIEIGKWKLLLKEEETTFCALAKGVIAGVTFGFVTPGRSAEFVGRVLYAAGKNKARIFYLSAIGGIAQTAVTLVCGVFFLSFWSGHSFLQGTAIGVSAVFLLLYFRFHWLNAILGRVSFLTNRQLVISNSELPALSTQWGVLFFSFVRYGVYLLQYVLVFGFFGVGSGFFSLLVHNGLLLLAQSFSPFVPLLDISYRGTAALFIFKNLTENNLAVMSATMVVWFINLVIPALLGYVFILRKRNL
jgi:hypothetical protein